MSDAQLLDTLEELRKDFLHRFNVHGRINFVTVAASWFADFYNENFRPDDPTEAYQVLQGFPTRSVDAGRGLWRLSRIVKNSPVLLKLFDEIDPTKLVSHLEGSDEGRAFLGALQSYLDEFGWRSDVFELSEPAWREDPAIPLNALQGYIALDESGDPELRYREAMRLREKLLAQARERLSGDSEKLARFNELYEMARHYLPVTENHNFYIDQVGITVLRLPILEIGRRLVSHGAVGGENDVFFLFQAEIREGLAEKDQRSLVAQRRAEIDKWSKIIPPGAFGEPPAPSGDPFEEAMAKFDGIPAEPSRDSSIINGIGASAGTAQGRAKVVRSLAEASKVQPGDVLVCEMTMPPWTPLFSTVCAVVADTGGVLSHCAIVAREYRMPCVVQTVVGTSLIKDGMLLTVDGSKGIVRIDSRI
jgi:pyruvate,water dikinase